MNKYILLTCIIFIIIYSYMNMTPAYEINRHNKKSRMVQNKNTNSDPYLSE
jgi:hypothetical protein